MGGRAIGFTESLWLKACLVYREAAAVEGVLANLIHPDLMVDFRFPFRQRLKRVGDLG